MLFIWAIVRCYRCNIVLCLKDKSGEISENNNINKYEELEKLQKLKESGAITDIEFEVEKQKLLR